MRMSAASEQLSLFPSTSSAEASPVRTSAARAKELASLVLAAGYGLEFARIVAECRPRWVVIENVRSGASKYVDAVRGELGRLGYASFPAPIGASDCGAPYARARVFHRCPCHLPTLARADASRNDVSASASAANRHASRTRLALMPTLTVEGNRNRASYGGASGDGLQTALGGGPLNPTWLEWYQGFPDGWTESTCSANTVVPQCAEVVGHVIRKLEGMA